MWDTIITILTPEEVSISLSSNPTVELGRSTTIDADVISSAPVDTVIWVSSNGDSVICLTTDCTQIMTTPINDVTYTATVLNEDGCSAEGSIDIDVIRTQNVYIPNVIRANPQNPRNAVLQIYPGSGVEEITFFRIYDRWGNLVHEEENLPVPTDGTGTGFWDGNRRGNGEPNAGTPLAPGVYVYVVELRFLGDPAPEIRKGDVTLIR